MPRWPDKDGVVGEEQKQEVQAAVEPPAKKKKLEFMPYTGRESLPNYTVLSKGKEGGKPVVRPGEPRFILARGERKTHKLIAIYKTPSGVVRKLWQVLKTSNKNKPQDAAIFNKLKAAGIPGAF